MPDTNKKYFGKVLLFGEHALIHGSPALARPTALYFGHWDFDDSLAAMQAQIFSAFHAYCKDLSIDGVEYQSKAFQQDLDKGLYFKSNLPIGYGVGSSGAVTAAIFDQYYEKSEDLDLSDLKRILGSIESFFHGKSSGFDPLVCYTNTAIKLDDGTVTQVHFPKSIDGFSFFLLDTGFPRETAPLVKHYIKNYETRPAFQQMINMQMAPLNRSAIRQTLENKGEDLIGCIEAISQLQWNFFEAMIPENIKNIWEQSLKAEQYKIKLCGAGGGGFLLGISSDIKQTIQELSPFKCLAIE